MRGWPSVSQATRFHWEPTLGQLDLGHLPSRTVRKPMSIVEVTQLVVLCYRRPSGLISSTLCKELRTALRERTYQSGTTPRLKEVMQLGIDGPRKTNDYNTKSKQCRSPTGQMQTFQEINKTTNLILSPWLGTLAGSTAADREPPAGHHWEWGWEGMDGSTRCSRVPPRRAGTQNHLGDTGKSDTWQGT